MTADLPCVVGFVPQSDPWLSGIIGRPALRLVGASGASQEWVKKLRTEPIFVTAKVKARDVTATCYLENLGFRMVDAALTFEAGQITVSSIAGHARFANAGDRSTVARIARDSFLYSRFHLDPAFPDPLAGQIKSAWAENFFEGKRGDCMVVAEDQGTVAGFSLLILTPDALIIDLIAVAPHATRKGLARAMIQFAAIHGAGTGEKYFRLRAGTQAANLPSVRLYESLGFRLTEAQFVLHHHGSGGTYSAGTLP